MALYLQQHGPDLLGRDARTDAIPAPPGYDVSPQVKEIVRELPANLKKFGLVTPWATRRGDLQWEVTPQPPITNLELYRIDSRTIRKLFDELYYTELPYLAVLTWRTSPQVVLEVAFDGTPYEYLETQAVYSQGDKRDVPKVFQLHWLRKRAAGDDRKGSLERGVARINGTLLFALQVPSSETSLRNPPAVSFGDALRVMQTTKAIESIGADASAVTPAVDPNAACAALPLETRYQIPVGLPCHLDRPKPTVDNTPLYIAGAVAVFGFCAITILSRGSR